MNNEWGNFGGSEREWKVENGKWKVEN